VRISQSYPQAAVIGVIGVIGAWRDVVYESEPKQVRSPRWSFWLERAWPQPLSYARIDPGLGFQPLVSSVMVTLNLTERERLLPFLTVKMYFPSRPVRIDR
jgi:hypothetical protein